MSRGFVAVFSPPNSPFELVRAFRRPGSWTMLLAAASFSRRSTWEQCSVVAWVTWPVIDLVTISPATCLERLFSVRRKPWVVTLFLIPSFLSVSTPW